MAAKKNNYDKLSPEHKRIANFLSDRQNVAQVKKVLIELVEQTRYLTKQDVGKWRQAWQRAISVEWPSRIDLYAVYRDVEIDSHLTGAIGQIKNELLQRKFKIVDRDSNAQLPDLEKQLEDAQWFIDFCGFVVDSVFYGYSLIEFDDVIEVNDVKKFACVDIVDREYVIPEKHVFVKNMNEQWTSGFDYTLPPFSDWVIGVGKPKDLGLFNKVAPHAIAKKNMLGFWDKFGEIFGMPIRIGKTSATNPKDRDEIATMLKKMGAAAWGMFPDGTDIEIKETTRGDAYNIYDKRIERANSEMSKAIVQQTMTLDNGSSLSQSETHLDVQEKVVNYFAQLLRIVINDRLIPFMMLHGFEGWDNARFIFENVIEYTPEERTAIEDMILNHFDVDPAYFKEKYNIPVIAQKKQPTLPGFANRNFFD